MVHEHPEKNRLRFRVREIISGLWELGQVFYMVEFVLKNSTTLMLCVFALEHVCRIWRFVQGACFVWDKGWRWSLLDWAWSWLTIDTPFYWIHPLAQFLYIFIFLYLFFISDFILYFLNIKKYQKYFYKFSHLFLYFILFFLTWK